MACSFESAGDNLHGRCFLFGKRARGCILFCCPLQAADKERSRVQSLVDEASRENVAQESNGSEALVCVLLKDDIHTRVLPVFASLHE